MSIGIVNDCFRPSISTLNAFNHAFPEVTVDFRTGSSAKLARQVRDGEVQMAIVRDLSASPDVDHVLWSEQLLWAGGPAYKHGDGPVPLVFFRAPCVYRQFALDALETQNVPHKIVVESTSWSLFERSLRAGASISLVTSDIARSAAWTSPTPACPRRRSPMRAWSPAASPRAQPRMILRSD
ncbi:LysR family transcriptional regulator substrate-binding protein [Mesorhizobium shangrilense]|uniref:LysR family transcriptional regulator substrate-binding protein n=1 Tax=Mesorhizobium shangrilense TaxID=460060 RepID=A0ABV2DN98_9HYPH